MHPSSIIEDELEALWVASQTHSGLSPSSRTLLRQVRLETQQAAQSHGLSALQPWLSIFEVAIDWLSNLHLALNEGKAGPPTAPEEQAPWALIGAASVFGQALQNSCVLGFDTPAKAQLRTYVEALLLCTAMLHDESLGVAYHSANNDETIKKFWHEQASPKRLHMRILEIERQLGFAPDIVKGLMEWRRKEYEVLSQASHLSIVGATLTCLRPDLDTPETLRVGIFGGPTLHSCRTLQYAVGISYHCGRLISGQLAAGSSCRFAARLQKESNLTARLAETGFTVLSEAVMRHANDT